MSQEPQPWDTQAVRRRLPVGAVPTNACWHPLPGRALRMSPDDVESMTHDQVRRLLPDGPSLVMSVREQDLDLESEADVLAIVRATDGGALVVGVAYELQGGPRARGQVCPECGSRDALLLGPADEHVVAELQGSAQLYQCADCASAWDG